MSGLAALDAVRERRAKKVKPPWVRSPFTPGPDAPWVIAFDPSLASTGWAVMTDQYPFVHEVGTINTKPRDGEEGNLVRGVVIYEQSLALLDRLAHEWRSPERGVFLVAHEAPPTGGSPLHRPDSIRSASLAVRIAATAVGMPTMMVSDLTVKKRLVGRSKGVEKADIKAALTEFWPHLPRERMRWNEHIRDAVGIGIVALEAAHAA